MLVLEGSLPLSTHGFAIPKTAPHLIIVLGIGFLCIASKQAPASYNNLRLNTDDMEENRIASSSSCLTSCCSPRDNPEV